MQKNKYTEQDFIDKCNELDLIYVGKHTEKKKGNIIEFLCKKHLDKGVQYSDWGHFRKARKGCSYCAKKHITTDDIREQFEKKHIKIMSEYIGCEKPIELFCEVCGNQWITVPKVITSNNSGCPKCGKISCASKESKTLEQFVDELYEINPNIIVTGKYVNTHTLIKCKCKIDGFEWESYPANLLNRSAGCHKCSMSVSERELLDTLNRMNINYVSQYSLPDCKYKKRLKFDAFDVENNVAFEYNGEQHYYPVDFAGKGKQWAEESFSINRKRDKIKKDYCIENNIVLIVIPYWERTNMESFLLSQFKELNLTQYQ